MNLLPHRLSRGVTRSKWRIGFQESVPRGVGMVASSSRVRRTPPAWTISWVDIVESPWVIRDYGAMIKALEKEGGENFDQRPSPSPNRAQQGGQRALPRHPDHPHGGGGPETRKIITFQPDVVNTKSKAPCLDDPDRLYPVKPAVIGQNLPALGGIGFCPNAACTHDPARPSPEAALTIVRMTALIASGSSGHATTTAARSGSGTTQSRVAFWVAVEGRIESD
jgi:hypothetical protein